MKKKNVKSDDKVKKSKTILLLLYPDEDETHKKALNQISKITHKYAYIKHDKDTYDSDDTDDESLIGTLKKEHYHVVLYFENQRYPSAIAKKLGIAENYARVGESLKGSLAYLTHLYHLTKFQYDLNEVISCPYMLNQLIELHNNINYSESMVFESLFHYIKNFHLGTEISITEFTRYCLKNGYYSTFRKNFNIFTSLIKEHNAHCYIRYTDIKNKKLLDKNIN